jgi:hypothetical protein
MLQRVSALASIASLAGVLGAAPALADSPGLGEAAPFLMPDTSERTHAGVDVFFGSFDADEGGLLLSAKATVLTFEPHIDLALTPEITLSGRLPIAYARAETTVLGADLEDSGTLLGNGALGARFMSQASRQVRAGGGVFVNLPTATGDDDPEDLVDPAAAATGVRLFHLERYIPDTTTLAVHGDVRFDVERAFLQGQVVYMHLIADDEDAGEGQEGDLLRLSAAAGFWVTPLLAVMGELTTLSTSLDDDIQLNAGDEDEDFFHSLDVGVRYADAQWSLGARFHLPLDDVFRDDTELLGGGADFTLFF